MFMINGGIPWTVILIPLLFEVAWSNTGNISILGPI